MLQMNTTCMTTMCQDMLSNMIYEAAKVYI